MYFSDEANFAYIIEALQVKKPATVEVKSSAAVVASPDPPHVCSNTNDTTSEAVQSVKELFPHLEASHIEVLWLMPFLYLIMLLLEIDC